MSISRQVAIVGIGQTQFSRNSGRTAWELALEAGSRRASGRRHRSARRRRTGALRAANRVRQHSDDAALARHSRAALLHRGPAGRRGYFSRRESRRGGHRVEAGVGRPIWRALNQSMGVRFGRADQRLPLKPGEDDVVVPEDGENRSFTWPYGQMSPAHIFGLWARRYMYDNGVSTWTSPARWAPSPSSSARTPITIPTQCSTATADLGRLRERALDQQAHPPV